MTTPAAPIRFLLSPSLGEVKEHVRAELFSRALTQRLGRPVVVELAPSYEALERELVEDRVDLAWATAEQCTTFEPQARAVLRAVRAGRWYYHAALVCRADRPLTLKMLKGTRAAWVAPRSTGGYLLPARHLTERGLPPAAIFAEERFHGTYRKALLALLSGEADVASIYSSHPEENTVRAYLAEHLGADERRLIPFEFTEPTLSDGLILTSRLPEADAATLVSIFTTLAGGGAGLEPLLGLFDSEGFVLASPTSPRTPPRWKVQRAEYLAVELDAQERCMRLWTPTGSAFGKDLRHAEGRSLEAVLGPEAGDALVALARAARLSGVGGRVEYRLEVEGETRWYAAEATVRRPAGGSSPTTALLVRDVTELRALEDELYRLASFPLLHPEPMLELGPNGELRYANPAAHTAIPDLVVRGAGHPLVEAALAWARRGVAPGETPPMVQLGGRYWELMVTPLLDPEGLRVFAKNVTARKQMEAQLFKADRMAALGSLAAAVGHEMGNPLAYMLANLRFAREELGRLKQTLRAQGHELAGDLDDVLEALTEATDGADRLKTIVQDLRMLSRAPPEHREPVEVVPLLEHALSLVRGELRHRARLEKDFRPVPLVEGDEARLGQVFVNLLLNAVQSMNELDAARNVLRVATYTGPAGEVVVEVQDTGVGMPPEVLARLFEPFFTTRPASMGLGLSVSHAIVTSLGGTLRAESREGVGTLLTVILPAAQHP
ncbi:PhnD/SsuA/transferrin family substrate-binding protein [Archangium violaceum]|uniref:sensor histidine kinase n=1 Tax=Archangium violaceum TaxID=83451 RepID=UPI00193C15BE|nr:PhnD/SsuA/transferrin family substrate-binding protein [Archangium violaceum]QRK10521.1 PhnD/SsuA/transferrin family substrate-binding protein [Archangium violaceum]